MEAMSRSKKVNRFSGIEWLSSKHSPVVWSLRREHMRMCVKARNVTGIAMIKERANPLGIQQGSIYNLYSVYNAHLISLELP